MDDYPKRTISIITQIIIALLAIVCAQILYKKSLLSDNWGIGLIAIVLLLSGAIIIAFPIAQWISRPAGNLLYPAEEFDRPQPMFSIPEGKRKNGHYQEAFDDFQKIADEYPQELKSYIAMIDIAIVDMKNKNLADTVFHRGIIALNEKEDRDSLARMHKAICSRLEHVKPSSQYFISPNA